MNNKNINNEIKKLNRKSKEQFLIYLINLEMQERSDNQELVFASPQKDD